MDAAIEKCDLKKISLFILNEIEGGQITGKSDPDDILDELYDDLRIGLALKVISLILKLGLKGTVVLYDTVVNERQVT